MTEERPKAPIRRYRLTLTIDADELSDIHHSLLDFHRNVELPEESANGCMGSPSIGWTYELKCDPEMTHDRYVAALNEYVDAIRPRPERAPSETVDELAATETA